MDTGGRALGVVATLALAGVLAFAFVWGPAAEESSREEAARAATAATSEDPAGPEPHAGPASADRPSSAGDAPPAADAARADSGRADEEAEPVSAIPASSPPPPADTGPDPAPEGEASGPDEAATPPSAVESPVPSSVPTPAPSPARSAARTRVRARLFGEGGDDRAVGEEISVSVRASSGPAVEPFSGLDGGGPLSPGQWLSLETSDARAWVKRAVLRVPDPVPEILEVRVPPVPPPGRRTVLVAVREAETGAPVEGALFDAGFAAPGLPPRSADSTGRIPVPPAVIDGGDDLGTFLGVASVWAPGRRSSRLALQGVPTAEALAAWEEEGALPVALERNEQGEVALRLRDARGLAIAGAVVEAHYPAVLDLAPVIVRTDERGVARFPATPVVAIHVAVLGCPVGSWLAARSAWPEGAPRDLRLPLGRVRLRVDVEREASSAADPIHGFAEMAWPPEILDPERMTEGRLDGRTPSADDFTAPATLGTRLVASASAPSARGASEPLVARATDGADAFDLVARSDRPTKVRLWRTAAGREPDVRYLEVQAVEGANASLLRRWGTLPTER
jgi:hypothetical protein